MIISRKSTLFLGLFIFVIPFLGLPSFWKTTLVVLSGLVLVSLSVKISIPRKNTKQRMRREKVTPVFVESVPVYTPPSVPEKIEISQPIETIQFGKDIVKVKSVRKPRAVKLER